MHSSRLPERYQFSQDQIVSNVRPFVLIVLFSENVVRFARR